MKNKKRGLTEEVTRFKMYKAGKKWVIAGITKCKFIIFSKKDEANVKVNQESNDAQYQKVYDNETGDGIGKNWKLLSGLAAGLGLGAISQVDNKVDAAKQPANEKKVNANALAQKDSVAISLKGSQNNSTSINGNDQASETMKKEQTIGINPTRIDIGGSGGNYASVGTPGGDVKFGYVNPTTALGSIYDAKHNTIGNMDLAITQSGDVYIYVKTTVTVDISFGFAYFDKALGADYSTVKEYIEPITAVAGEEVYVYLSKEQLIALYEHINSHNPAYRDGLGYVAALINGELTSDGELNPKMSGTTARWNTFISSLSSSESASESASTSKLKSESESASKEKSESESASKTKSESESTSRIKSESESASKAKSESESASKAKSESESASKTKSESESSSKIKSESESASKAKSESESSSKLKSESESMSKIASESESTSLSIVKSESESTSKTKSESESASKA
ncbi:KxYKxGKxW signal peptide domain-containing protein [Lactobacillus sp. YT155]|uniref:KxYKxGKxW signal peptide domain-containing protein n=1 Tax=Lactobacillus sp. YT155 TaxID=3060955 RepID=UPI00265F9AA3|nr:KxYKxGKxW signal peptide domain-containing protein [Lactobacillus sp. YT155]MDO1605353.1 KxYKxGKxW signal peptide domain-containing protein [Lactobacillus sp. YT155]